jgi:hypothetical protein
MITNNCFKVRQLILAAVLILGLGPVIMPMPKFIHTSST